MKAIQEERVTHKGFVVEYVELTHKVAQMTRDTEKLTDDINYCRMWEEKLKLQEEKLAAREEAIKQFRKHGKGSR